MVGGIFGGVSLFHPAALRPDELHNDQQNLMK
jgi:hypothetical protein